MFYILINDIVIKKIFFCWQNELSNFYNNGLPACLNGCDNLNGVLLCNKECLIQKLLLLNYASTMHEHHGCTHGFYNSMDNMNVDLIWILSCSKEISISAVSGLTIFKQLIFKCKWSL